MVDTQRQKILDFPAHSMISFFENHALLNRTGQHQWFTVKGGSIQYVERLNRELVERNVALRLVIQLKKLNEVRSGSDFKSEK